MAGESSQELQNFTWFSLNDWPKNISGIEKHGIIYKAKFLLLNDISWHHIHAFLTGQPLSSPLVYRQIWYGCQNIKIVSVKVTYLVWISSFKKSLMKNILLITTAFFTINGDPWTIKIVFPFVLSARNDWIIFYDCKCIYTGYFT